MRYMFVVAAAITAIAPWPHTAQAQSAAHDHSAMDHAPVDHSKMDHSAMDHGTMDHDAMDHGAHQKPAAALPATRGDHPADAYFDPARMEEARRQLRHEHGGGLYSMILLDTLEYRATDGYDGYAWDGEVWVGGDIHRFVAKSKGEGARDLEHAEAQALYSYAIGPYFNLQAGARVDVQPDPTRGYAVFGVEGLAPYWFEVEAHAFVSDQGDLLARLEASYDILLTQNLVLAPEGGLSFAAQDIGAYDIGAGFTNFEAAMRLRYEIRREFAPYVGIFHERKIGKTASLARLAGEHVSTTGITFGIRAWF